MGDMGDGLGVVLPFAVSVAISPIPIVAVLIVLLSSRARVNGPVFLLGWLLGVGTVAVAVYALASGSSDGAGTTSDTEYWIRGVSGVALGAFGAYRWFSRRDSADTSTPPRWIMTIDRLAPVRVALLAILLSAINPKNFVLSSAAGAELARTQAVGVGALAALVAFVVVASASIAVPVTLYVAGGETSERTLTVWRTWLLDNHRQVMAGLFMGIGLVLVVQSTIALAA